MAHKFSAGDLIPGLPDEVSDLCLLRLPFPCPALLRSVSSTWNRTLSNPSFFTTKSSLSLTKPYLLVLVQDPIGRKIQLQCLDPASKKWCPLPPMPIPDGGMWEMASIASSVAKEKGEMYVFRGDPKNYCCVMVYSVATNSWRVGNVSMKRGYFFTSAAVGGKVFAFSDNGDMSGIDVEVQVQCYDPVLDSLHDMPEATCGINSYDAAVVGNKVYVTKGWFWHSDPDSGIYDTELNTWEDMPVGMREGWTGLVASLGPNLFMLDETGDRKVEVYNHVTDSWMQVMGSGIPELVKKPYEVAADDETGKIYVVGRGLNVAIATLIEVERKKWEIEWDVVKAPNTFSHFCPYNSQILYA